MALYPTYDQIKYRQMNSGRKQKVLIGNVDELGKEVRKRKWLYKKRTRTLSYEYLTKNELRQLLQFQDDHDLIYTPFVFIDVQINSYSNEYIATGDGSTDTFNMPCKSSTSRTIYINGLSYSEATDSTGIGDFYIIQNGGIYNVDQLIFFVAPLAGTRITCDFKGQLAFKGRLAGEIQSSINSRYLNDNQAVVSIQGLLWDSD